MSTDSSTTDVETTEVSTPENAVTETSSTTSEAVAAATDEASDSDGTDATDATDSTDATDGSASKKSKSASVIDTEGEVAADYLEELLDIADLDGDIDTYAESGRAQVSIVTDSQVLMGKDGEVLEALQELVRLAVMAETGNRTRLMLDVAGFRERRRKELRELAADAVQEVKDAKEAVRLAPMNPFERKIVHDAVADAGLVSESEGEEPNRRVLVLPA